MRNFRRLEKSPTEKMLSDQSDRKGLVHRARLQPVLKFPARRIHVRSTADPDALPIDCGRCGHGQDSTAAQVPKTVSRPPRRGARATAAAHSRSRDRAVVLDTLKSISTGCQLSVICAGTPSVERWRTCARRKPKGNEQNGQPSTPIGSKQSRTKTSHLNRVFLEDSSGLRPRRKHR